MSQDAALDSTARILSALQALLAERQQAGPQVATREEEAEKVKNQALLAQTAAYTPDSIVNGLAALQLNFSRAIADLSDALSAEADKLTDLKRAIAIATDQLEQLRRIRIVADASYIRRQEHQERLQVLAADNRAQQEILNKEQAQTRKQWAQEQADFEARSTDAAALTAQAREQEEADYAYQTERDRAIAANDYADRERHQSRELQQTGAAKERDWAEREQVLAAGAAKFQAQQEQIASFEAELQQAYSKAKGDAIAEANREAKVKTDLLEKEWEAAQQGYDLQIADREAAIARQREQIADLTAQLQAATNQAQSLAMRAFQPPAAA